MQPESTSLRQADAQSHECRRTFSRSQRLSRSTDIATVKQTGRRVKAGQIDVRIATSPLSYARVGIVVPKYKKSIVERNKLRRRLRELVRVKMLPVIKSQDVLIKTFPKAYDMTFDELAREIEKVVARIA